MSTPPSAPPHASVSPDPGTAAPPDELAYLVARRCLVGGFAVCAALVGVSLVLSATTGDPIASSTHPVADLPGELADGDPGAAAQLAIFAMLLTPIATTLGVIWAFLRVGDRRFAGVSALVLVVLSVSMVVGLLR